MCVLLHKRYVKMGAHHTLEMELHRAFCIEKDDWDLICLERIDDACDQTKKADAAAVVLEPGLAHVCLYVFFFCFVCVFCGFLFFVGVVRVCGVSDLLPAYYSVCVSYCVGSS